MAAVGVLMTIWWLYKCIWCCDGCSLWGYKFLVDLMAAVGAFVTVFGDFIAVFDVVMAVVCEVMPVLGVAIAVLESNKN